MLPEDAVKFEYIEAQSAHEAMEIFKFRNRTWDQTPRVVFCEEMTDEKRRAICEGSEAAKAQVFDAMKKYYGPSAKDCDFSDSPERQVYISASIISDRLCRMERFIRFSTVETWKG